LKEKKKSEKATLANKQKTVEKPQKEQGDRIGPMFAIWAIDSFKYYEKLHH
jgi:hypothetical protein